MQLNILARACSDSALAYVGVQRVFVRLCTQKQWQRMAPWHLQTAPIYRALVRGLPVCPRRPRGWPLLLLLRNELVSNGPVGLRKQEKWSMASPGNIAVNGPFGTDDVWKGIKTGSSGGNVKKKKDCIENTDGAACLEMRDTEWWRGLDGKRPFVAWPASSGY